MIKECFKIGTVAFCAVIRLSFDKKKADNIACLNKTIHSEKTNQDPFNIQLVDRLALDRKIE